MNSITKTSIGLDENIEGAICYLFGVLSGFIIFVVETDNRFVRFHAAQSTIVFGILLVIGMILSSIPHVVGYILGTFLYLIGIALWIILMTKAYQHELYKLPVIGDIAEKISSDN